MDDLISRTALVGLFPTPTVRAPDPAAEPWYSNYSNILRLARHLAEMGESASDLVYFLEKPWKWTLEWEHLVAAEAADR